MMRSNWQESSFDRNRKLTITDIHRLKDLNHLIEASEKKLSMLQQESKNSVDEAAQEKAILKASKQLVETLEGLIMFFDTQQKY